MEKYSPSIYIGISYDDLLIYALYEVINDKQLTTFENLVARCFKLFPERFQLPGYSQWPDSSLVDKSWLRCRTDKGLIYGSKSKGFTLTPKGLDLAKNIQKKLHKNGDHALKPAVIKGDLRTRSGRFVKHVEKSSAFQKFVRDKNTSNISEFEFCDLVYSTLDTNPSLRKRNIKELKYHANVYGRVDIIKFLENCEGKFSKYLIDADYGDYKGGMMRRKK
jgi:hypothetical protein